MRKFYEIPELDVMRFEIPDSVTSDPIGDISGTGIDDSVIEW